MPNWVVRLLFWLSYLRGRTPWDTNVTPPELVRTVEGTDALPTGRALDLGCGTGTNVIYLARRGWEAVGVDFIQRAIHQAQKKAQAAGVEAQFFTGDVTRLEEITGLDGHFDLIVDIGCFHSLTPEGQTRYAASLARWLRPGGIYLLYAWGPGSGRGGAGGINPHQVKATLGPHLRTLRIEEGEERGRSSAWCWFQYALEK